jgi:molybdate transport system ATP-binding protein
MLELAVQKQLGDFALEAKLEAPAGSTLVLVGESGAGKTTLLRLVAGLTAPDRGAISLGGEVLADAETRRWLPPERRRVGYVPQDYALFPHLSVESNVGFGLGVRPMPAGERRARVDAMIERLELGALRARRPHELSGGQRQRVALARALVLEPQALLLDEPLAALDVDTRRRTRAELTGLLPKLGCITLYVTHQPAEALLFGQRIAVLEAGRVTQVGNRDELLHRPRTRHIAEFLGTNLFQTISVHREDSGLLRLTVEGGEIFAASSDQEAGLLFAVVDPREITLATGPQSTSAQNVLRGRVAELQLEPPRGERVRVRLDSRPPLVAELTRAAAEAMHLEPGAEVWASFKATGVRLFA